MKENNLLAIRYFRTLIKNGWIEPICLMKKIKEIEADMKKTKDIHKQRLLKTQKMVIEEVLR